VSGSLWPSAFLTRFEGWRWRTGEEIDGIGWRGGVIRRDRSGDQARQGVKVEDASGMLRLTEAVPPVFRSHRRISASALFLICLTSLFFAADASAAPQPVVVLLNEGASATAEAAAIGVKPTQTFGPTITGFSAQMAGAEEQKALSDPNVLMVAPNIRFSDTRRHPPGSHPKPSPPSLPPFGTPLTSFRQFVPPNLKRIGLEQSPTADINGRDEPIGVGVATVDTGIDTSSPELNVAGGVNCSSEPGSNYSDLEGHGTEVAGVLAAEDNSFGVVGVAPGTPLYSVRVLNAEGEGELSNLLCGLNWIAAHRSQIRVLNMSLVAGSEEEGFGPEAEDHACGLRNHDPLHFAICKLVAAGITVVAGAGNEGEEVGGFIPAGYSQMITASGLADTDGRPGGRGGPCADGETFGDDVFAPFSNYGSANDVAAVATCIYTDYENVLALDDGTSFAAPAVSGAAALLLKRVPWLTPQGVKAIIEATAERDGSLAGDPRIPEEGVLSVRGY
jgi:subtilisin